MRPLMVFLAAAVAICCFHSVSGSQVGHVSETYRNTRPAKLSRKDLTVYNFKRMLRLRGNGAFHDASGCASWYPDFPYRCADGKTCIAASKICDGRALCRDGSDEDDCPGDVGDDDEAIDNGSAVYDSIGCAAWFPDHPYRCRDGTMCIREENLCDGDKLVPTEVTKWAAELTSTRKVILSRKKKRNMTQKVAPSGLLTVPTFASTGLSVLAKASFVMALSIAGTSAMKSSAVLERPTPTDALCRISVETTVSPGFTTSCSKLTNYFRCLHGVPPLTDGNPQLTKAAQEVANENAMQGRLKHSSYHYGENLAVSRLSSLDSASGYGFVKMWHDEIQSYNFENPEFNSAVGHFTQVIWTETINLGCGVARWTEKSTWLVNTIHEATMPRSSKPTYRRPCENRQNIDG
ncbi:uncharacterized protein [Ptychodera flava]|uniref:uncharacterized protein n=1 Tax=Ptychodera flava TaxID=63121 RepID=UPI00396A0664